MAGKDSTQETKTVTTKEISEILGLSTRRINQLEDEKALIKVARGKFDLAKSVQSYIEYQIQKAVPAGEGDLNKYKEETLWTRARRQKAELELKIMNGELHRSKDIEQVMNSMLASFRSQLLAFPTKIAPLVIAKEEVAVVKEILKKEVFELMDELSDYNPDVFYNQSSDKLFLDQDENELSGADE